MCVRARVRDRIYKVRHMQIGIQIQSKNRYHLQRQEQTNTHLENIALKYSKAKIRADLTQKSIAKDTKPSPSYNETFYLSEGHDLQVDLVGGAVSGTPGTVAPRLRCLRCPHCN